MYIHVIASTSAVCPAWRIGSSMTSRALKSPGPFDQPVQPDRPDSFHGWVTVLVHQHRARLTRVVRREGVRADDALDCVQEAFLSFLGLRQAPLLVGLPDDSARMLIILARNIARDRRRRHDYARPHIVDDAVVQELA